MSQVLKGGSGAAGGHSGVGAEGPRCTLDGAKDL